MSLKFLLTQMVRADLGQCLVLQSGGGGIDACDDTEEVMTAERDVLIKC